MRKIIWVSLFIACALGQDASAQSLNERIERDKLAVVEPDDPHMAAAMRKARQTLPQFLAQARAPKPSTWSYAVKVAVKTDQGDEYFWIAGFRKKADRYTGRIDNTPRWAKHLKEGDALTFAESEIVDWVYVDNGKMKGNFTFCALLQHEPRKDAEAAIRRFGLDCVLE